MTRILIKIINLFGSELYNIILVSFISRRENKARVFFVFLFPGGQKKKKELPKGQKNNNNNNSGCLRYLLIVFLFEVGKPGFDPLDGIHWVLGGGLKIGR